MSSESPTDLSLWNKRLWSTVSKMASREMLEDVVEWLTEQLKGAAESLKSTSEDFRQALKKIETLEKEHERVVH